MKLHEQLTSPELSNKLHQLGVTAPSIFWRDWTGSKPDELEWAKDFEPYYCEDNVNAYSATEHGEMLQNKMYEQVIAISHQYVVSLHDITGTKVTSEHEDTEADARAKMLIYLLENKLIELGV